MCMHVIICIWFNQTQMTTIFSYAIGLFGCIETIVLSLCQYIPIDQSIDEGMEETDIAQKDTSISSETSPEADNKEFIPRMDYVETFNIGSQDESMEDD